MIPSLMNGKIFPVDDKMHNYYYRCYFEPNYIKHDKIRHDSFYYFHCFQEDSFQPLIYELHFPLDKKCRRIRKIMLVFQENKDDGWGRCISETMMERQNRYVAKADGIIFMADPFQIPEIRVRIEDVESAGSSCMDKMDMHPIEMHIARIANILRVEYGLKKVASSLGHPLVMQEYIGDWCRNREKLPEPQSHRIADAFFWILNERGILK